MSKKQDTYSFVWQLIQENEFLLFTNIVCLLLIIIINIQTF